MKEKQEPKNSYEFYVPADTREILYKVFTKIGKYDSRRGREKRKDWCYRKSVSFSVNPALLFAKVFPCSKKSSGKRESDDKGKYLRLVSEEIKNFQKDTPITEFLLKRQNRIIENLCSLGF